MFLFTRDPIDTTLQREALADRACGGYASFEGWVRNHNEGQRVTHLEYEAFEPLAIKEGERILAEALERFGVEHAACLHRAGDLAIGEMAVWVGVSARHRDEAFLACRYIIDEVKHRLPIWKKEHYENGDSGWVNCERCAAAPHHGADEAQHRGSHEGHHHGLHEGHHHRLHERHDSLQEGHHQGLHGLHESVEHAPRDDAPSERVTAPDYSRQMALNGVGPRGQERLRASCVLVVGAGGLGVPVLTYLAGAGIGRLGIVDGDRLEASNLHRQTLYALADVGQPKAALAAERLTALNPEVQIDVHPVRLDAANGAALIEPCDLVIDCSDNFATKFLLNDLCMGLGKPVILSSVYQLEGQLQVVRPDRAGACLRCIWPEATRDGIVGNCAEAGVLGPVPGVFGSLQALEALKVLLDLPGQLGDELLVIDLSSHAVSRVRARRASECRDGRCARLDLPAATRAEAPAELSFDDLAEALRQDFVVIDVREPREVADSPAPVERVLQIPLHSLLEIALRAAPHDGSLDRSARYLLVCASGKRSLAATQELRARGFRSAYSLRGGLAALERSLV
jgi:sulfur-carrier protein adenylyltransferase/sulfurtransferase